MIEGVLPSMISIISFVHHDVHDLAIRLQKNACKDFY